jgi:hypothetical protein
MLEPPHIIYGRVDPQDDNESAVSESGVAISAAVSRGAEASSKWKG